MAPHTLPVEILFAILETLRDHGDVRTLERCRSTAPGEVQRLLDSIIDIRKRCPSLDWNQGQRIRQFIDKLSPRERNEVKYREKV
jgi:hypothetical protein